MDKIIKKKAFQVHFFCLIFTLFVFISVVIFLFAFFTGEETEVYWAWFYMWLGGVGFLVLTYSLAVIDAGTDYFNEQGMARKFGKKVRFELPWSNVRLLKYRRWGGVIPICSIGVPEGTFTEETFKKNFGSLIFSSGVVLCMRKKKFQEIIDLIPEEFKQNMQIEV